jgi:predicted secreted protein
MRYLAIFLAVFLSYSSSFAGDADKLAIIGFSKDASHFAFETYGVGDGSGLGYSDIYIIDVKSNSWVQGSPIHMRGEDENQTQAVARAGALKQAAPLLAKYGIGQTYELLALNPITEIIANRKTIEFDSIHRSFGNSSVKPGEAADNRFVLQLTEFPVGATAGCLSEDGARFGFALQIKQTLSGKILDSFKDATVPTSRGCPFNYELDGIVSPDDESGSPILVAMVAYYTQGFEGPDRKYIAVPFTLP